MAGRTGACMCGAVRFTGAEWNTLIEPEQLVEFGFCSAF